MNKKNEREISWPENTFHACLTPQLDHDLIVLQGVEPNNHWRDFCKTILTLIEDQSVSKVISMGGLIADVFHGDPISVSGSTSDPSFASFLGISKSRYEGPTGILGILNDKLKKKFNLIGINNNEVVMSCGSSVTASSLALAYSLINDEYTAKIYIGSWAEYGRK